jgi:hypothetical protein
MDFVKSNSCPTVHATTGESLVNSKLYFCRVVNFDLLSRSSVANPNNYYLDSDSDLDPRNFFLNQI